MSVEELFEAVVARLLAEGPAVTRGRMFRSTGLKIEGKFFAFVRDGRLVLKLPARRVDELEASGAGYRFDRGDGRLMKEWVVVRPADEAACEAYLTEARDFVAAQARGADPGDSPAPPSGNAA